MGCPAPPPPHRAGPQHDKFGRASSLPPLARPSFFWVANHRRRFFFASTMLGSPIGFGASKIVHRSVDNLVDNSICGGFNANLSFASGFYKISRKNRQALLNL